MAKQLNKNLAKTKTPELTKASEALKAYLKANKLDPSKDWTKDKKHGKQVTKLVKALNKERDKVAANYPETDPKSMKNLKKKAKVMAEKQENALKKKKAGESPRTKYDYPLVDGREMTKEEKKKYRAEQRRLKNGGAPKKEKKAEKPEKPSKKEKKAKDSVKPAKVTKKTKKSKKEED